MSATPNLASNFPNVAALSNAVLAYRDVSSNTMWTLVETFLSNSTQSTYESMVIGLDRAYLDASFQAQAGKLASGATKNMLRILVAIDDGTVAYDSGNATSASSSNTWSNFTAGTVNSSNHNTRPEVLTAVLSSTGVGIANRYSRSSAAFLKYQATRLGTSAAQNVGTFRVSITDQAI
jgi:hypothetical protein